MRIWAQAASLAEKTPPERNRYVDFLRAVSITFVIIGHWLIATAYYASGQFEAGHMLSIQPWTQWLTWLFQVMPVFFIVGGYANAVSLESARRRNINYASWLNARLNRLVAPLLVLLLGWTVLAVVLRLFGVGREVIQLASQASLIPIWFLAIYIMIVVLAPAAYQLWQRLGWASVALFATLAVLVDLAFFALDQEWLGWSNYFWVWLAVHQLGFAWRDGRTGSPAQMLLVAALGLGALVVLVMPGPYPLAMVGKPSSEISNTLPPKITLLALGGVQFGLMLAAERPMRRILDFGAPWTATILVNSMIMTVYLWHMTLMVIVVGLLYLADGFGIGLLPGSAAWWWTRPVWLAVLLALLLPLALLLAPLERRKGPDKPPSVLRLVFGALLVCAGVASLALYGVGGGPRPGTDVASLLLVLFGAVLAGLLDRATPRS